MASACYLLGSTTVYQLCRTLSLYKSSEAVVHQYAGVWYLGVYVAKVVLPVLVNTDQ